MRRIYSKISDENSSRRKRRQVATSRPRRCSHLTRDDTLLDLQLVLRAIETLFCSQADANVICLGFRKVCSHDLELMLESLQ